MLYALYTHIMVPCWYQLWYQCGTNVVPNWYQVCINVSIIIAIIMIPFKGPLLSVNRAPLRDPYYRLQSGYICSDSPLTSEPSVYRGSSRVYRRTAYTGLIDLTDKASFTRQSPLLLTKNEGKRRLNEKALLRRQLLLDKVNFWWQITRENVDWAKAPHWQGNCFSTKSTFADK